jgi:thymidylate synthase ThyX
MMTLTTQPFTPLLGFALPRVVDQAGCTSEFNQLMQRCRLLYPQLESVSPGLGAYVLPNAFNRRFLITTNLRSAIHFINLRAAHNAHFSVRRLAEKMAQDLQQVLPSFAPFLFTETGETWQGIEENYFSQVV